MIQSSETSGSTGFSVLQNVQTGSGAHPAFWWMRKSGKGVRLTTHLQLVLRLSMRVAVSTLMTCKGKILLLHNACICVTALTVTIALNGRMIDA
jgi:hypothetical protein